MKPVVCIEVTLRQMEHVVVVEKIPGSGSRPRDNGLGQESFPSPMVPMKLRVRESHRDEMETEKWGKNRKGFGNGLEVHGGRGNIAVNRFLKAILANAQRAKRFLRVGKAPSPSRTPMQP